MPRLILQSTTNPRYAIDTAAGRYLVFCFFGSATLPPAQAALAAAMARSDLFDDDRVSFFGISADPADMARLANQLPGRRFLWDTDLAGARACGAAPQAPDMNPLCPVWIITDPTLRVIRVRPLDQTAAVLDDVAALPPPDRFAGRPLQAPILYLPNVFEPDLCAELIALYEAQGGLVSGVMREVDGRTVGIQDKSFKSRRDVTVEDPALIQRLQARILRRIVPEIAKVHQFNVTRMERYMVCCYSADEGGHFTAHRDNTTPGTAHRRFAVSINLNDDFTGGEVSFPEYAREGFKAAAGGAVVFSCSLLHAVSRVESGRRYAFLPFLYDDAAAAVRRENLHLVGGGTP